jgi:hypothetical protein
LNKSGDFVNENQNKKKNASDYFAIPSGNFMSKINGGLCGWYLELQILAFTNTV